MFGMEERFSFGVLLRGHRERRDWAQKELAYHAGYTAQYIVHIERGRRVPTLRALCALCDALEVDGAERLELLEAAAREIRRRR